MADDSVTKLRLMVNYSYDETCPWKFVEQHPLPPSCLPAELESHHGIALKIIRQDQWILRGAVQSGLTINVPTLSTVCRTLNVKLPGPRQGSGAGGRLKRQDYVTGLINHLWPDCTSDFFKSCYQKLMGEKTETTDLSVLSMVGELDTDNQESFECVKKDALKQLEAKIYGKGKLAGLESAKHDSREAKEAYEKTVHAKAKAKAEKIDVDHEKTLKAENMKNWGLTPPELKELLPGKGEIPGQFWMRWHPTNHWWRVTYPTGHLLSPDNHVNSKVLLLAFFGLIHARVPCFWLRSNMCCPVCFLKLCRSLPLRL